MHCSGVEWQRRVLFVLHVRVFRKHKHTHTQHIDDDASKLSIIFTFTSAQTQFVANNVCRLFFAG